MQEFKLKKDKLYSTDFHLIYEGFSSVFWKRRPIEKLIAFSSVYGRSFTYKDLILFKKQIEQYKI